MCLYYKNRTNLTYNSGEHILPAALGGIQKLPVDYVSSQFNTDISKLELDFIRNSFVSVAREIEGPGHRGKLAERYAISSPVQVIEGATDKSIISLGYMKKGKLYEIPHLSLNVDTKASQFSFSKKIDADVLYEVNKFKEKCARVDQFTLKVMGSGLLPINQVLLGFDDVEAPGGNCYFAKNPEAAVKIDEGMIKRIGELLHYKDEVLQNMTYMPRATRQIKFSLDFFRVYGKIAFNFLAFIKSKELLMTPEFDAFRAWVAGEGDNRFATINGGNFNGLKEIGIALPDACHHVLIYKVANRLIATIHLYEALSVDILLHPDYKQKFVTDGLICDWKNRREYRLADYLSF